MAEARSLADIKLDNAYKFGAGRYLQEAGALNLLGGEVARLGKKALVIAGPRAWAATEGKAEKSLKDAGVEFELSLYPDQNTYERAKEHALQALTTGCQVIVGVGGGRIMDQAKATAHFAGDLPIVEVPTSIATCAAFAPLSVMYTAEGASLGSLRYDHEVNAIVMDMDVICKEPPRYAASGIMDGTAKMIEIQNGRSEILLDDVSIGLFTAYTIAEMAYHVYEKEAHQACHDIAEGKLTKAVEDIAYLNVAVAGIVSGVSKGHGFSGVIQRWNQHTGPMAHGSKYHRGVGSMGANSDPSRVFKNKHMPGHFGVERVTVQNLEIVKVDEERNLLLIKGAVPGANGGLLLVRNTCKA